MGTTYKFLDNLGQMNEDFRKPKTEVEKSLHLQKLHDNSRIMLSLRPKEYKTIVEDINNGVEINIIFNYWLEIKNRGQHDIFEEMVKGNLFGTYKNQTLLDILDNFNKGNCSTWQRESFIKECRQALKLTNL